MDIKKLTDHYIYNTYKRNPVVITRAKGSWVWDNKGKKYLDFFSGLAVSGIGHALPAVVSAIKAQSKKTAACVQPFLYGARGPLGRAALQALLCGKGLLVQLGR